MDAAAIERAVSLLVEARRRGGRIAALPEACRPADLAEAHAIQDATVAALGTPVGGWKAGFLDGAVMRGAILDSWMLSSPARVAADRDHLRGVEAEIAFRVERGLPNRASDYAREEVAEAVTALVAIEVVDSRFRDYNATPVLDRAADFVSNDALVLGAPNPHWRDLDLARLEVVLTIGGQTVVRQVGGHSAPDPLDPAVALVNALKAAGGVQAGQIVTTGTFTGLRFAEPGQTVVADFLGFGSAEVRFEA